MRKTTKNRGSFPNDELLINVYLALQNICEKWAMPLRDWESALNRFATEFAAQDASSYNQPPFTQNQDIFRLQ